MLRSAANLVVAYTVGTVIVLARVVRAERRISSYGLKKKSSDS